jgi:polysaccharide deacetylase family protein (PEP-CTERM system associated)
MTEHRSQDSERIAGWATRMVPPQPHRAMMTVDVEDYFQVEAFFGQIDRADWDGHESRVERNTARILDMFAAAGTKATFFTLGWVAKRYPALIRRMTQEGHEVASHGLEHRRCDSLNRASLLADLKDSKALLEDLSGRAVAGYRAASFSVTRRNLWAHDAIAEAGYRYSSSIYPIRHDLYGIPEAPRFAFRPFAASDFFEIPVTSFRLGSMNLPAGGGGYFRLLPYWWSKFQLKQIQAEGAGPAMFYFHPWEIDPGQPRIPGASLKTRIRHYTNLGAMQARLEKILREFPWSRVDAVYPAQP